MDVFIPNFHTFSLHKIETNPAAYALFDDKKTAFFNHYDYNNPSIHLKNDLAFFGGFYNIVAFHNPKLISFSAPEIKPIDAQYESLIRNTNLYQIKPFPMGGTEQEIADYQDEMLEKLGIEYVIVSKKRTMPPVLERWQIQELPIQDKQATYYKLLKINE
jgi:hypothetical protein